MYSKASPGSSASASATRKESPRNFAAAISTSNGSERGSSSASPSRNTREGYFDLAISTVFGLISIPTPRYGAREWSRSPVPQPISIPFDPGGMWNRRIRASDSW